LGGICQTASSVSSRVSAAMSARSKASAYRSSRSRCSCSAGALQRAVHRGRGDAEHLGGLLRRPGQHVPQDEHRPLLRGQVLQGGDEGQPQSGTPGDDGRGIGLLVGDRLQPRDLRIAGADRDRVRGRAAQPGRQHPAAAVP
jgi:hypothetical protein